MLSALFASKTDWRSRAQIFEDVVFFTYVPQKQAQDAHLVYVWDLDKTYLETHFESLKGLIRTALEKAFQKRNVPGTNTLVRALISSQGRGNRAFPIFFISASPPQIEEKIHQKLQLDNIRPFGCFYKDNLQNLTPKRFKRLTNHMGYKIQALLELRVRLRLDVQQILWGDDSESDAVIYSLYSDICARRLSHTELLRVLKGLKVEMKQIHNILLLQEKTPPMDPVKKIYINLAVDTDPEYYLKFGRRMVATYDTFQASLDLYQDGHLDVDQITQIAHDMINNYAFTPDELAKSVDDLLSRQILKPATLQTLVEPLTRAQIFPVGYRGAIRSTQLSEVEWVPQHIDYLFDYR
ncbi:MAG: phosphatase domain-containing protein [Bdellovibrionales bacterium]